MTPARSVLAAMLLAAGGLPKSPASASTEPFTNAQEYDKFYHGLNEVNLLEGLSAGTHPFTSTSTSYSPSIAPSFSNAPLPLALPSTRIGAKTRKQDFALPASPPPSVDLSSTTPTLATRATLRKSFRRTLPVVSSFRVRMRTVFVPYILFDSTHPDAALDDALAAGHAERTVMLCVEIEHPGQAPEAFSVDAVEVTVGGAGDTRVRLLSGDGKSPPELFPLRLSPHEQYNLLFAVELLSAPISEKEALLSMSASSLGEELQRPVTITVRGQPFSSSLSSGNDSGARVAGGKEELLFPTQPFPSRWNCVLDLAPQRSPALGQTDSEVLPEPPSPFPTTTPRLSSIPDNKRLTPNPVAGSKRFTMPSGPVPRSPRSMLSLRASTGALNAGVGAIASTSVPSSPSPLSKFAYMPPSVAAALSSGAPPTTYAPPPSPGIPPPAPLNKMLPMAEADEAFVNGGRGTPPPPATPAYPAYPKGSPLPATPRVQGPLAAWGAASVPGAAVEPPRGGAAAAAAALLSRARVSSSPSSAHSPLLAHGPSASASAVPERERIVVSVGMHGDGDTGARRLVPHDEFVLDVFVFNQSAWTRRFEVSVWERRRRRQGYAHGAGAGGPGIVPLESRVRVGYVRSPLSFPFLRFSCPLADCLPLLTTGRCDRPHASPCGWRFSRSRRACIRSRR